MKILPKTSALTAITLALLTQSNAFARTVPTYATADRVLGQSSFTFASYSTSNTASTLRYPEAVVIDPVSLKVFVSDSFGNRVLRYRSIAELKNGAKAEAVFGQPTFTSDIDTGFGSPDGIMNNPHGLFIDRRQRLWVADRYNNRVLMYTKAATRKSGSLPDKVLGQPNLLTKTGGTAADKMDDPVGLWLDRDDRLWVADSGNNRVLIFDQISKKPSGGAADRVLGQKNFTSDAEGTGKTGLQGPFGIAISRTGALFVACARGNRVLRFDNAATLKTGAEADGVLGQPNFSSTAIAFPSATSMRGPIGLAVEPNDTLWVSVVFENRVLRFDRASSKPNGAAANAVVGQPDFSTTLIAPVSRRALAGAACTLFVDGTGNLWVPDNGRHRVLRFPANGK